MNNTFEITHDREFLQHFLTSWRTKSISPQMVEKLKENKDSDPYAAYGYGRWLLLVNPGGQCLEEAESLLERAGKEGVQDANAALAQMYYTGRTKEDRAMPRQHALLMSSSYQAGSELAQFMTLENTVYGDYGYQKDPALTADILQKHLEKSPESDTIYYDLLGQALEPSDQKAAEKAYLVSLERGDTESYYSLANLYRKQGHEARACKIAEVGAQNGAVNCYRFKAGMDSEDFQKLSPGEQDALHKEIEQGLDYAIAHYDGYACFLKAALLYDGSLGYPEDKEAALEPLEAGCEMGRSDCYWLKAYIQEELGINGYYKNYLQAMRLGEKDPKTLEAVAKGYVSGALSKYDEEIEQLWLKKYVESYPEPEEGEDRTGVVLVYPRGFYYAKDTDSTLNLDALAENVGARGFDVVHFSPVLTRINKALALDDVSCHVAMLVDKDGYMKDLPDNMPGTMVYGNGQEIRGTVIFVLEDNDTYTLMPILGLRRTYMLIQLLTAATGDLIRTPSRAELKSIGAIDEADYDDEDDEEFYDDPDIFDTPFDPEQEIEED